jgi:hypothetical protein
MKDLFAHSHWQSCSQHLKARCPFGSLILELVTWLGAPSPFCVQCLRRCRLGLTVVNGWQEAPAATSRASRGGAAASAAVDAAGVEGDEAGDEGDSDPEKVEKRREVSSLRASPRSWPHKSGGVLTVWPVEGAHTHSDVSRPTAQSDGSVTTVRPENAGSEFTSL